MADIVQQSTVEPAQWQALAAKLRGTLDLPGTPTYDAARQVWNGMIDRRPAAIARCLGTTDVQHCVRFARETGTPLSIKGGGHNIAGLAVADGALTIDMSAMRGVWVDPQRQVARAQGGCLLGDVDGETQLHGLAAVLGFVSATGVAGLTLGGGFGYLTRRFGWTSDNVAAIELVTADARLVRASESENADLFWGLRGGGGNFGVVTGFEYRLFPVGPEIYGGMIVWPATEADAVIAAYRELVAEAPPELTAVLVMRIAPPAPWLPAAIHGKPVVAIVACHSGTVEAGERALAPLKALGQPAGNVLQRRPYVTQQTLLDATQPKGRRYYWKSEYLSRLDDELFAIAGEHFARMPPPWSAIIIFPIGDASARLPADHSAVGNRDARFVLNVAGSWEKRDDDETNVEWARAAWSALRRFSTGGTYINFLTEDEGAERISAAYGANLARLAQIKRRWDPENLFRANKNIAPAG